MGEKGCAPKRRPVFFDRTPYCILLKGKGGGTQWALIGRVSSTVAVTLVERERSAFPLAPGVADAVPFPTPSVRPTDLTKGSIPVARPLAGGVDSCGRGAKLEEMEV
jgi:hypothetical protein